VACLNRLLQQNRPLADAQQQFSDVRCWEVNRPKLSRPGASSLPRSIYAAVIENSGKISRGDWR
jgi:hypothetical protein